MIALLAVGVGGFYVWQNETDATIAGSSKKHPQDGTTPAPIFNKQQFSLNDPTSIWVVVNKGRILPSDYAPSDLVNPEIKLRARANDPNMTIRREAAEALKQMNEAASADLGSGFALTSGYRSYQVQFSLYNSYVKSSGVAYADATSAHAGHSEHQTGFAADLEPVSGKCALDKCFADTPEGQWLAANSYKYGFVIRYQTDTTAQTGYDFEPWHVRYLGVNLATKIQQKSATVEQFFGLPYYTDYPAQSFELKIGS